MTDETEDIEQADPTEPTEESPRSEESPGGALAFSVGSALVVAAAFWFALQPERAGDITSFFTLFVPYLLLGGYAVLRMKRRAELHLLRPRPGDVTFGALVAFLLYGLAFVVHALFTSHGEPREGWIIRVYLLLGNPLSDARHLVAIAVTAIGLLEELTWRGLITPMLEPRWGPLRAAALSTALWSAAHLPTVFLLADPVAGPNPLLVAGTIGCGFAWSYLRWRMERLVPVLLSHGLFTWAIVEFPLWSPPSFGP